MNSLLQIDRDLFVWVNTYGSNSILDTIMPWLTRLGDAATVWLWIALLGLLMTRYLARSSRIGQGGGQYRIIIKTVALSCLYMALIYGINAGVYNGLKHLFHRPRPFSQQTVILRVPSTAASGLANDSSFPSGHATNAFMIAALLAEWFRRKRYVFYGLAALVAFSRIYLGVHYPNDVVVGACLGLTITWLMLLFRPLINRMTREDLFPSPN